MLDENSRSAGQPKFMDMTNVIHVDEKWFNATKKDRNFYLLPDEVDPHRTVQNKNSIDKVMFLGAVANPRFDDQGNCTFEGKLGLWPFIRKVPQFFTIFNTIFDIINMMLIHFFLVTGTSSKEKS